jgi:hypothetical protein
MFLVRRGPINFSAQKKYPYIENAKSLKCSLVLVTANKASMLWWVKSQLPSFRPQKKDSLRQIDTKGHQKLAPPQKLSQFLDPHGCDPSIFQIYFLAKKPLSTQMQPLQAHRRINSIQQPGQLCIPDL